MLRHLHRVRSAFPFVAAAVALGLVALIVSLTGCGTDLSTQPRVVCTKWNATHIDTVFAARTGQILAVSYTCGKS